MIDIIDNFLPYEEFSTIKNTILSNGFPWFYNDYVIQKNIQLCQNQYDFQFGHVFYNNDQKNSQYFDLLMPIFSKLNLKSLVRVKANLVTKCEKIISHGFHTDYDYENLFTAIFYVNTNDGYTIFEDNDNTKVESIENRLVIFPSTISHSGTTCTDQKIRCVLNINYF